MKIFIKISLVSFFFFVRLNIFAQSSFQDSSKKLSYVDSKQLAKIFLISSKEDSTKTFQINEVIVIGNRINFLEKFNPSIYEINITESPIAKNQSLGSLINFIPGVFVRSYGAEGSLQTISFRGISSEYSNIIFNGVNLSNSLSG
ncbi:MAG: Plug domain-containing protein, partial [Ignavibacteria bacterium]|nr:Plug domain-containing protein [Ignavibacteria bacterium]